MSGAIALLIATPGVVLTAAVAGLRLRSAVHLVGTAAALTLVAAAAQLPFGLTSTMAAAHVTLFAVALAAAAFGSASRAWFRDPLDAAGLTLAGVAIACGGLLMIGQLAARLPVSLLNAALTLNPIVAVTAAADIDLVRMGRLYDLLPIAHGTFAYPGWSRTLLVYLAVAATGVTLAKRAPKRPVALLVTALAAATAAAPAQAAARAELSAQAGLNGIVRPGRWVPVAVTVTTGPGDIDGHLIVEWGSARASRDISLAAPSTRRFAFFLRTGDVRDRITVRLEANGATVALADAFVTVIDAEDAVTACIGEEQPESGRCTLTIAAADVPTSYRALDGIDTMVGGDSATGLTRDAIQRWSALRTLEVSGNSAPAVGALPSTDAAPRPASRGLWYAAAMLVLGGAMPLGRRRPLASLAVLAATAGAGVAGALTLGTSSPVLVRHASVAESFVGISGSAVSTHATIALPGIPGTLTVRDPEATATDLAIADTNDERFNDDGALVLAVGTRLGQTVGTRIAAWAPTNALAGTGTPGGVRVTNVSSEPLSDCALPAGFEPARLETLAAGASVEGQPDGTELDPVVVCRSNVFPLALHYPGAAIEAQGNTSVVLHLSSDAAR